MRRPHSDAASVARDVSAPRKGRQRPVQSLVGKTDLVRQFFQRPVEHDIAVVIGEKFQVGEYTRLCRPQIAQFEPCPQTLDMARQRRGEGFGNSRVRLQQRQHGIFRIDNDASRNFCDGVAMIGVCEQGGLGERFPGSCAMDNDRVTVGRVAFEAHCAGGDGIDGSDWIALMK